MNRLLLVDDDLLVLQALDATLNVMFSEDVHIEAFTDPKLALARMNEVAFDVILSDYRMPDIDGIQFLQAARAIQPYVVRLLLSGTSDFTVVQRAINEAEIYRYLFKPCKEADLLRHVGDALQHATHARTNRDLANTMLLLQGALTLGDWEYEQMEDEGEGLSVVEWGADGEAMLPPELLALHAARRA